MDLTPSSVLHWMALTDHFFLEICVLRPIQNKRMSFKAYTKATAPHAVLPSQIVRDEPPFDRSFTFTEKSFKIRAVAPINRVRSDNPA